MDGRVFRDWEKTLHECIDERVQSLKLRHINKRKKHMDYLDVLHENFVLVPADKVANNVIVVCKKYYLDVVINKLSSTST